VTSVTSPQRDTTVIPADRGHEEQREGR
jgi:hypothetical protein